MSMRRLSRDEAFLIAVNIAKLPSVPRQILKDIPGRQIQPAVTIEPLFQSPPIPVPDITIACTAGPVDGERMCLKVPRGLLRCEEGVAVGGKLT